jgi:hypothetical protein
MSCASVVWFTTHLKMLDTSVLNTCCAANNPSGVEQNMFFTTKISFTGPGATPKYSKTKRDKAGLLYSSVCDILRVHKKNMVSECLKKMLHYTMTSSKKRYKTTCAIKF